MEKWICDGEEPITTTTTKVNCEEEKWPVEFGRRAFTCPVPFWSPWQFCVPSGGKGVKEEKERNQTKRCHPVPKFPSNRHCTACDIPHSTLSPDLLSFYLETLQSEQLILSPACLAGINTFWRDSCFPLDHQKEWTPENLNFPRNLFLQKKGAKVRVNPLGELVSLRKI